MTVYLIGARGRLGQAIAREYADDGLESLDRSVYGDWSQPGAKDRVSHYFALRAKPGSTIFVASGLLDPKLPDTDLQGVNYHLPKNVIDGVAGLGIRVLTFGTVMERLLRAQNPYIQSKAALGAHASAAAAGGGSVAHLQIHTLFGVGQPSPFMFLGQMLAALRDSTEFRMTSGRQLREYHHLEDEARAVRLIAESNSTGVLNVSHGEPISLASIAHAVFQSCGREDLLQIGALPDPPEENYEKILSPIDGLESVEFRDSLPAIIKYMQACHPRLEVHE